MHDHEERIRAKCDELANILVAKNKAYGDSALNPVNIFAYIDDKLSRIRNGCAGVGEEDDVLDLAGYLILLMIDRDQKLLPQILR